MTVVVSDLVARFRADLGDVQRGAQQARQEMAGVAQEAKATGEQLDALARKFQQSQGSTVAQWRQILDTQKLSAGQVDTMLGRAAQSAQQVVQPTQAAARAAGDLGTGLRRSAEAAAQIATGSDAMHRSFELSNSTLLRVASAAIGIPLGLNLAAGAAGRLHQELVAAVDAAVNVDRVTRGLGAAYGSSAGAAQTFAQGLGAQAGLAPTTVASALTAARPLSTQFGLSAGQVQQLTSRAADLAAQYGRPFDETFGRVLEGVQSGGNQLEGFGVRLDDVAMKTTAWNGALAGTFDRMTQAQQVGERFQQFLTQTSTAQGQAAASASTLSGALDRLGTANQRLLESIGAGAQGPATGAAQGLAGVLNAVAQLAQIHPATEGQPTAVQQLQIVRSPTGGYTLAPTGATSAAAARAGAASILEGLQGLPGPSASAAPVTSIGPMVPRAADLLSDLDRLAGPAQARLAAAQGGIVDIGLASSAQLADLAGRRAESTYVQAQIAQRQRGGGLEQQLGVARGLATTEGERNRVAEQLSQLQQYRGVMQDIVGLEHDQAAAQRSAAEAQTGLESIALRQRERTLQMLNETVDLRRLDNAQQQTGIRLGMDVIRAQQAALPVGRVVAAAQYQQNLAQAISRQRMARLLQGQDVSDLPTVDQLIQQNVSGQLAAAEAEPEAVRRGYDITLAQQPATAAGLAQQLTSSQLQLAQLGVDLKNLGDLPKQTALELELVDNNRSQLSAQQEIRELIKKLVWLVENRTSAAGSLAPPTPSDLPGSRRGGPF